MFVNSSVFSSGFPFYNQHDKMDCGPACLRMVAQYHGIHYDMPYLRSISGMSQLGVSLQGLIDAAEILGFKTEAVKLGVHQLSEISLPSIVHWNQNHFVVLYKIKKTKFYIADPASGKIILNSTDFNKHWLGINEAGIALILTPVSHSISNVGQTTNVFGFEYLFSYLKKYRELVSQLILCLFFGSLLQIAVPFLTKSIIDVGLATKDIEFIYIILSAQIMLFVSRLAVDFIKSWLLLYVSSRINIALITDFLVKLMKLPMHFFDSRTVGDILQRINDQKRIENFLTVSTLNSFFYVINLFFFSFILAYYSYSIFLVFLCGCSLNTLWILFFQKERRILDVKRFEIASKNQSEIIQLITGIHEIKLNNCTQFRRGKWESIQAQSFRLNIKSLSLSQTQQIGAFFLNEGKNILITFLVAKYVIEGYLTFGTMMAIQYIVGQLNSPVEQLLVFIQQSQETRISLERLNEINVMDNEEGDDESFLESVPSNKTITFNNVSFSYPGVSNDPLLKNINFIVPEGKTTAIVGMSGSGKTTILKLLLRFYNPDNGQIQVGNSHLNDISFSSWRDHCGVVMQDGYIFSDTIAMNIAVGEKEPNLERLSYSINIANLNDFIETMPLGVLTIIGAEGLGISNGQKQRILIARAVYKNPDYMFLDEATNSLDANNEKTVITNMGHFFKNRTVLIVAHRLTTVMDADNIILLQNGVIAEQGTHDYLLALKGKYYELVKNQLELGS